MKKVISLALLGATSSLMALGAQHAYLYKDPRIMGMGGANIAVGAYSSSVFSNPAGLTNIKKEHGIVVDVFNLGISTSEKTADFADELDVANDAKNSESEMVQVLKKYSGENFHIGVDNYTSISKNSDAFAWSIGFLTAGDINFIAHGNGTSSGSLLEVTGRAYGGIVLAVAKPYETRIGIFDVGMSVKYISQTSYEGVLGISELTDDDDDLAKTLQNKYENKATGYGIDIGFNYKPLPNNYWKPTFGLSILNIGGMDMDDSYGGQPMTVNIGMSITPEISFLNKLVIAVDYMDILNENTTRIYDFNVDGTRVSYTDYEESDSMKRLRFGMAFGLVDSKYFSTTLSLGMYQGAYTAGVDMELLMFKLNVATYEEQIGTGTVDIPDRRYMAKIGLGW